jgi:DNA-binding YbaB/EbfC family protein
MSSQLEQMGEELKKRRAEASTGGGMVTVEVNGAGEVLRCRIDPSLFNGSDRELVEDLIAGAANQAVAKAKAMQAEAMKSLGGLPGVGEMLAQLSGGVPPEHSS